MMKVEPQPKPVYMYNLLLQETFTGLHKYIQGQLLFTVTPSRQAYGLNLTVNWQVPTDQATSKDWIG